MVMDPERGCVRGRKRTTDEPTKGEEIARAAQIVMPEDEARLARAIDEAIAEAREPLSTHIKDLERRREVIATAIPQMYGEALAAGLPVADILGHEWDNRTSEENAVWLIETLRARLAEARHKSFDAKFADALKEFGTIERLVDAYREAKIEARQARLAGLREAVALCGACGGAGWMSYLNVAVDCASCAPVRKILGISPRERIADAEKA